MESMTTHSQSNTTTGPAANTALDRRHLGDASPAPAFSRFGTLSMFALILGVAPSLGCAVDADDDEVTSAAQQADSVPGATGLDFGGAFGYVAGNPVPNPATGSATCPAGYTTTTILGTINVDYPVHFCSRPPQVGSDPVFDFGGMWGYVGGALASNPITNAGSCPDGYTDQTVLGAYNVDYPLHVCYKPHAAGTAPAYRFGGMWGHVNATATQNPATGAASCPSWFASSQVLGTFNVDYPLQFCWQLAGKYPAQAQVASIGGYLHVTLGVTVAPGKLLSFEGHGGGLATPGANGTWGDFYSDDIVRLFTDTVSFQCNTTLFYTNVNFFDGYSNYLGSYHGGGIGIVTGIGGGTGSWTFAP